MSARENKMMWGRCTWILFHNIVDKIDSKEYIRLKGELFGFFTDVCMNLPCRICAGHASKFISKVHINSISTRELFKSMLFQFHNEVNKQTGKPPFTDGGLSGYKNCNLATSPRWSARTWQSKCDSPSSQTRHTGVTDTL